MLLSLLLAVVQALVMAQATQSTAATAWTVESVGQRCPGFTDRDGRSVDVARCQITEWDRFAELDGETYCYAIYRVDLRDSAPIPVSDTNGEAVFAGKVGERTLRLFRVIYEGDVNPAIAMRPSIVTTAYGSILNLPARANGTSSFDVSSTTCGTRLHDRGTCSSGTTTWTTSRDIIRKASAT